MQQTTSADRKVALALCAVFVTQFVNFLLINARNIANPVMIAEFEGVALFPWLIKLWRWLQQDFLHLYRFSER